MRAKAYEFAEEVDRQIELLTRKEYLQKVGRGKILREELFPLSRLGLHLKRPGNEVLVEAFEDDGPSDGHIHISGFEERDFEIQITFADYNYAAALRDELLFDQGMVPGTGEIYRDKYSGKIVAKMASVDFDEHVRRISNAIIERITEKTLKFYSKSTVLLIAFEEYGIGGRYWWGKLFETLDADDEVNQKFRHIYLFNCWTNETHLYTSSD